MSWLTPILLIAVLFTNKVISRSCKCTHFAEYQCDSDTQCKWHPDHTICRSIQWFMCEQVEECKANRNPSKPSEPDPEWPYDCPLFDEENEPNAPPRYEAPEEEEEEDEEDDALDAMTTADPMGSMTCGDYGMITQQICLCTTLGYCSGAACEDGPPVTCRNGGVCCCGADCGAGEKPSGPIQGPPPGGKPAPGGGTPPCPPEGCPPAPPVKGGPPPPKKGGGSGGKKKKKGSGGGGGGGGMTPTYVEEENLEFIAAHLKAHDDFYYAGDDNNDAVDNSDYGENGYDQQIPAGGYDNGYGYQQQPQPPQDAGYGYNNGYDQQQQQQQAAGYYPPQDNGYGYQSGYGAGYGYQNGYGYGDQQQQQDDSQYMNDDDEDAQQAEPMGDPVNDPQPPFGEGIDPPPPPPQQPGDGQGQPPEGPPQPPGDGQAPPPGDGGADAPPPEQGMPPPPQDNGDDDSDADDGEDVEGVLGADINIIQQEGPDVGRSIRFGYAEIFIIFMCLVLFCCGGALCWNKQKNGALKKLVDDDNEYHYKYATFSSV